MRIIFHVAYPPPEKGLTPDWEDAFPRKKVIRLASNNYWSSSEYSSNNAWNVNFNNGNVNNNNKNNNYRVVFVRDMEYNPKEILGIYETGRCRYGRVLQRLHPL